MPCYQQRTVSVEFKEATDLKLLADALTHEGFKVSVSEKSIGFSNGVCSGRFANGRFDYRDYSFGESFNVNRIKQAYSREVVKSQAKKYGWQLKALNAEETEFEVIKH